MFEGKTILISGGAGFLGNYLIATFLKLNKEVFKNPCKVIAMDNFITSSQDSSIFDIENAPNILLYHRCHARIFKNSCHRKKR